MRAFVAFFVAFTIFAGGGAALAAPTAPAKTSKATGKDIVVTAQKYRGTPYKYGGTSPKGFDCSGFVWYVYAQHGINLPRTADKQYEVGMAVKANDLKPGDVVFFTTEEKGPSHCGIFVGQGKFIHASSSRGVMVSGLADQYWKPRYIGARRML
jgi:cell wall-associated NlpC family hydrolase